MSDQHRLASVGVFSEKIHQLCAAIVRHDPSAWSVAQREWWVGAALDAKSAADDMVVRIREMQKRERELVATIEILNRKLSTADASSQAARLSAMEGAT